MTFLFEDYGKYVATNPECFIDNLMVASSHGPLEYNTGAH